jgi:hypothetical protein
MVLYLMSYVAVDFRRSRYDQVLSASSPEHSRHVPFRLAFECKQESTECIVHLVQMITVQEAPPGRGRGPLQ